MEKTWKIKRHPIMNEPFLITAIAIYAHRKRIHEVCRKKEVIFELADPAAALPALIHFILAKFRNP